MCALAWFVGARPFLADLNRLLSVWDHQRGRKIFSSTVPGRTTPKTAIAPSPGVLEAGEILVVGVLDLLRNVFSACCRLAEDPIILGAVSM